VRKASPRYRNFPSFRQYGLVFVGLIAVALSTFAATFLRSEGLVMGVLVVGLACVVPVSLAVASGRFYPARPAEWSPTACPHCGGTLVANDPGPIPNVWPGV
jgi:hypothetical protein